VTPQEPPRKASWGVSIGAFIAGFFVALVLNFVLAVLSLGRVGTEQIVAAWVVTLAAFGLLYAMQRWAAYGALGAYAALFFILLIAGGATGPWTCFNAYGYPQPTPFR